MALPRLPEDPATPGAAGREQQQESTQGATEGLQPHGGKEKKRVGFASDKRPQEGFFGSPFHLTPNELQGAGQDYFSYASSPYSSGSPPLQGGGPTRRDSLDGDELAAALRRIWDSQQQGGPATPSMPRPVLRKSTNLPTPSDHMPTAPLRSEVEAKNRADRLAYSVGTSSIPVSRRGSADSDAETVNRDGLLDGSSAVMARDFARPEDSDTLTPRRSAQLEADRLVRSHKLRRNTVMRPPVSSWSGTVTPIEHDLEYVPRPEKYKGGVLGPLLRLYSSQEKSGSPCPGSSAQTTPASTPPTSRSSTPNPESRRLRAWRTHSPSTIAGLMGSSLIFAAPGSSKDMSEKAKEQLERPRKSAKPKKKEDEVRIKIHIADIICRHTYLLKLCKALMIYGAPTHRLEAYMRMSARILGIEGQFMYLPDTMIISFGDGDTHTTEVKIVRASQGLDFGRLRDVHEIYKEVVHDRMGVEEATARLDEITSRKPRFPVWLRILLYGVASAMVAPFGFEGRYIDMPICFILGCLVGFLQLYLSPSNELYANVFEITAAVATSFLARLFGSLRDGKLFCFSSLAQASIALILPGYMVLCASLELQSHQMISGSVRMVYALIYTLFLGYGFTIGSVIYGYINSNAVSEVHCSVGDSWYTKRPPENYYILFVFPFTLCLCFINQAKWKQTPVQVVISLAGFCVNNFSARFFKGNGIVSSSLGALAIGVLANLYSRLGRYSQNWFLDIWERHFEPRLDRLPWGKRRHYNRRSPYNDCPPAFESDDSIPHQKREQHQQQQHQHGDPEMGPPPPASGSAGLIPRARKIGYGLAAAAMLPAIFVQVPSGLAASGSLLSGVTSADQIVRNETILASGTVTTTTTQASSSGADLNNSAFNVLFSVIQVAINISVGLSLSALLVYPFGKRRSGLLSF